MADPSVPPPPDTLRRPVPLPFAPDLTSHPDVLRQLLALQSERLADARALEVERGFIFPETTVIARDVQRLSAAVNGKGEGSEGEGEDREGSGREGDRPDDPEVEQAPPVKAGGFLDWFAAREEDPGRE